MIEKVLSGVEWCVYNNLFWLQKNDIIPNYPWDTMKVGEEKLRGHDQGFGGNWHITEQEFVFQWDILPNTLSSTPVIKPTTLTLLVRGELPIGPSGKPMESKEAQRRWFIDKFRLEKPTGGQIGEVQEMTVIEAESRDDVFNLLNRRVEPQAV